MASVWQLKVCYVLIERSEASMLTLLVRMLGRSLGALWPRELDALVAIAHGPRDVGGLRLD